jgi:hypothetical protein
MPHTGYQSLDSQLAVLIISPFHYRHSFFFNHSIPGVLWKHESGQKETVWPMSSLWRLDRSLQNVEKESQQVQDEGDAT